MPRANADPEFLTPKEWAFVSAYVSDPDTRGSVALSAKKAGFVGQNSGYKLFNRPKIRNAIKQLQDKAINVAGTQLGKQIAKSDIVARMVKAIDRLDQIAEKAPKKGGLIAHAKACDAIVKACDSLAELTNNKVRLSADVTKEFEGRSDTEKEFFAVNGYWPDAPNGVDANESGATARQSPSAPGSQPN